MTRSPSYIPILALGTTIAVAAIIQQQRRSVHQTFESDGTVSSEVPTTPIQTTAHVQDDVPERQRLTLEEKVVNVLKGDKEEQDVQFTFHPIGTVHSVYRLCVGTPRQGLLAPHARGQIELTALPLDAVAGLEGFSHIWVLFCFHLNTLPKNGTKQPSKVVPPALGGVKIGVLATRSPHRPNPIGMTLCKLDRIRTIKVKNQLVTILDVSGLDLVDETPVLDIKPFVPHYDTSDAHMGNTTLPSWVADGLETRRRVTISTLAKEQLLTILRKNPKALIFYGPHRGDLSEDETFHQVTKCIEEILSIDVRSSWQTQKARQGKSQAERANRVKEIIGQDREINHKNTDEEEICTQQIDNLLLHFTVVEQHMEQQRTSSKGSGAEDSVHVKSIRFIGSSDIVKEDEEAQVKAAETEIVQAPAEGNGNKELDVSVKLEVHSVVDKESLLVVTQEVAPNTTAPQSIGQAKPSEATHDPGQIEDADYKSLKTFWSKQASQNTPTGLVPASAVQRVTSREKFFVFSDRPIRVKVAVNPTRSGSKSPSRNATAENVTTPTTNNILHNDTIISVESKPVEKEAQIEKAPITSAPDVAEPTLTSATTNDDPQQLERGEQGDTRPLTDIVEDLQGGATTYANKNDASTPEDEHTLKVITNAFGSTQLVADQLFSLREMSKTLKPVESKNDAASTVPSKNISGDELQTIPHVALPPAHDNDVKQIADARTDGAHNEATEAIATPVDQDKHVVVLSTTAGSVIEVNMVYEQTESKDNTATTSLAHDVEDKSETAQGVTTSPTIETKEMTNALTDGAPNETTETNEQSVDREMDVVVLSSTAGALGDVGKVSEQAESNDETPTSSSAQGSTADDKSETAQDPAIDIKEITNEVAEGAYEETTVTNELPVDQDKDVDEQTETKDKAATTSSVQDSIEDELKAVQGVTTSPAIEAKDITSRVADGNQDETTSTKKQPIEEVSVLSTTAASLSEVSMTHEQAESEHVTTAVTADHHGSEGKSAAAQDVPTSPTVQSEEVINKNANGTQHEATAINEQPLDENTSVDANTASRSQALPNQLLRESSLPSENVFVTDSTLSDVAATPAIETDGGKEAPLADVKESGNSIAQGTDYHAHGTSLVQVKTSADGPVAVEVEDAPLPAFDSVEVKDDSADAEAKDGRDTPTVDVDERGVTTAVDELNADALGTVVDSAQPGNVVLNDEVISAQAKSEPEAVTVIENGTISSPEYAAARTDNASPPMLKPDKNDSVTFETALDNGDDQKDKEDPVAMSASEDTTDQDDEGAPVDASMSSSLSSNNQSKKRRKRKKNKK